MNKYFKSLGQAFIKIVELGLQSLQYIIDSLRDYFAGIGSKYHNAIIVIIYTWVHAATWSLTGALLLSMVYGATVGAVCIFLIPILHLYLNIVYLIAAYLLPDYSDTLNELILEDLETIKRRLNQ